MCAVVLCVHGSKYDYKFLCMPSMPWSKGGVNPPLFLGKDDKLGLFLALTMGLQHALAMVAGIATSGGALIAGDACFIWQRDQAMCATKPYLINAAWCVARMHSNSGHANSGPVRSTVVICVAAATAFVSVVRFQDHLGHPHDHPGFPR